MRRAPLVVTGTMLGLAGVIAYHPGPSTRAFASKAASSGASKTTATSTTATSTTQASSAKTSQSAAATGEDVSYQYGDIQLKATVSGGKVTEVSVAKANVTDPRSESIDEAALPQLREEALSAQSSQINGVSGASYTSAAYKQSLQSALDKLGIKA
jgi:uncharacterized protein with FMN-binding domain